MTALAYYNEIDPRAAAWLRELIAQGHIAPGIVDDRSIMDVRADDLAGFAQCHFFAGIGVWSAALRGAGWPDARNVWTGSCPCQPFSAAGKQSGKEDERHLWPEFFRLIRECRPSVVFGEQVASPLGLGWLDTVSADLEGASYAVGAADLCAAGVGAPHIRQRLYFVADAADERLHGRRASISGDRRGTPRLESERLRNADELANADDAGSQGRRREELRERAGECVARPGGASRGLADADGGNASAEREQCGREQRLVTEDCGAEFVADAECGEFRGEGCQPPSGTSGRVQGENGQRERFRSDIGPSGASIPDGPPRRHAGPTNGHWRNADWLRCTDGKWRPVEPESFPLAHGALARVGRLRGYGNAIVKPLAQEFIAAYLEAGSVA